MAQSRPSSGRSLRISRCHATGSVIFLNVPSFRNCRSAASAVACVGRSVASGSDCNVATTFTFPRRKFCGTGRCNVPSASASKMAVIVLMPEGLSQDACRVKPRRSRRTRCRREKLHRVNSTKIGFGSINSSFNKATFVGRLPNWTDQRCSMNPSISMPRSRMTLGVKSKF